MVSFHLIKSKKYNYVQNVVYCGRHSSRSCLDCPDNSICKKGILVGCRKGYSFIDKEICLRTNQLETLVYKMYLRTLKMVAKHNGDIICNNKSKLCLCIYY